MYHKRSSEELEELKEYILSELPVFVIAFGYDGQAIYNNRMAADVFKKEIIGLNYLELLDKEYRIPEETREKTRYECWVENKCYMVVDTFADILQVGGCRIIIGHDVTDVKNYLLNYSSNAMMDQMTGTFSRQAGLDVFNEILSDVHTEGGMFSVVFLDLDDLKYVNDNYGHAKGDDYIITVCNSIKACIRKSDIVARLGGDEFLIILPKCNLNNAERIMSDVVKKLNEVNETPSQEGAVYRISYGVTEVNSSALQTGEQILNSVDNKMYEMKNQNKSRRRA